MRSNYLLGNSDDLLPWRQAQQTGKTACPHLGTGERIQNRSLLKSVAVFHDESDLHGQQQRRPSPWLPSLYGWSEADAGRPKKFQFLKISFSADTRRHFDQYRNAHPFSENA